MKSERTTVWRRWLAEGGVIVMSILLAFAIDASWDRVQARSADRELLRALLVDFRRVHDASGPAASNAEAVTARGRRFLAAAETGLSTVPLDSLRVWYSAIYTPVGGDLNTPSYDALITSASFDLVGDAVLRDALGRFVAAREYHDGMVETIVDSYFFGPVWEIRRQVGLLEALTVEDAGELSIPEPRLRNLFASSEAIAALDVVTTAMGHAARALSQAHESSGLVVERLDAMLNAR